MKYNVHIQSVWREGPSKSCQIFGDCERNSGVSNGHKLFFWSPARSHAPHYLKNFFAWMASNLLPAMKICLAPLLLWIYLLNYFLPTNRNVWQAPYTLCCHSDCLRTHSYFGNFQIALLDEDMTSHSLREIFLIKSQNQRLTEPNSCLPVDLAIYNSSYPQKPIHGKLHSQNGQDFAWYQKWVTSQRSFSLFLKRHAKLQKLISKETNFSGQHDSYSENFWVPLIEK